MDEPNELEPDEPWGQSPSAGRIILIALGVVIYGGALLKQLFAMSHASQGAMLPILLASTHLLLIVPVLFMLRHAAAARHYALALLVVTGFALVGVSTSPALVEMPERPLVEETLALKEELGARKILELQVIHAGDVARSDRKEADRRFAQELADIVNSYGQAYRKDVKEIKESVTHSRRKAIKGRLREIKAEAQLLQFDKDARQYAWSESWIHYLLAMFGLVFVVAGVARDTKAS